MSYYGPYIVRRLLIIDYNLNDILFDTILNYNKNFNNCDKNYSVRVSSQNSVIRKQDGHLYFIDELNCFIKGKLIIYKFLSNQPLIRHSNVFNFKMYS